MLLNFHRLIFSALLMGSLGCRVSFAESEVPSVDLVYRKFIEGNGGRANVLALNTLVINARLEFVSGDPVEFRLYRKRPGMMRMRRKMAYLCVDTIFNGKNGWRQTTSAASGEIRTEALPEEEVEELRQNSSIEGPFFRVGSDPANIASVEFDTVGEIPAIRLDLVPDADCIYSTLWLDAETYQELKMARFIDAVETGQSVYEEIILSDSDQIEGVHFAQKMEYYHDGELVKTLLVDRIRANVGLFDSYFSVE